MAQANSEVAYLQAKIVMKGTIECLTGLHIGGAESGVDVGGIDKFVVRNPLNDEPYIPGSSIKGKIRMLIEYAVGTEKLLVESSKGRPGTMPAIPEVEKLFGVAINEQPGMGEQETSKSSKVIFRDAIMTTDEAKGKRFSNGLKYTERKAENVLARITGKATPRQIERVPAGTKFKFSIVINKDADNPRTNNEDLRLLNLGFELLKRDGLGGMISRGYGQVAIEWTAIEIHEIYDQPRRLEQHADFSGKNFSELMKYTETKWAAK